jgi:hypothetical protein
MIQKLDNLNTRNNSGLCTDKYIEFVVALDRTGSGSWSLMSFNVNVA